MFKNNDGFTLIEMLIVLMIISVLIILIVPTISDSKESINDKGCEALITVVQTQVDLFNLTENRYPENIEELMTEDYITESQGSCPDGSELEIENETVKIKRAR